MWQTIQYSCTQTFDLVCISCTKLLVDKAVAGLMILLPESHLILPRSLPLSVCVCVCVYRIINLELLSQYGSAAWRAHNEVLKRMLQEEQNSLEVIRSQIQEVNRQRKLEQSKAGDELSRLETQ